MFRLICWNRTRACCTPSCRYTRCLRCSCWSGPRDEVIQLYQRGGKPRGVTCVDSNNQIFQIWTDPYHRYYNKLKNDLRLPLTNTVKELEENLDFGIQKLIKSEPGLVNNDDEKH